MRPRALQISAKLSLPALAAQTQTLVVYGAKGMGKTNFAAVVAEELDEAGLRFSWIDPVGVAWGIKYAADGRGAGVPVLILGGIHGDLPIDPASGGIVADLVVDESVSVVIDISRRADGRMWGAGEKTRFVRDYCVRLFERQGEQRRPIMQIIDEAGRFVPQIIPAKAVDIAECVGAIEQLVELGRNVGVGVTLVTQRSARMAKSVSELAEMMVAFRTVGPRSIDSIMDWFGEHIPRARALELVGRLRELDVGTALVVSPGWLRVEGEYPMRARRTFDSSATPKAGEERGAMGKGAAVDLDRYRDRLAETIEKAQANDPRVLAARVRELEHKLAAAERARSVPAAEPVIETKFVALMDQAGLDRYMEVSDLTRRTVEGVIAGVGTIEAAARELRDLQATIEARYLSGDGVSTLPSAAAPARTPRRTPARTEPAPKSSSPQVRGTGEPDTLPVGEKAILGVVAQYPDGATREQLTVISGYKKSSRDAYIRRLAARGHVTVSGNIVAATPEGVTALGSDFEPLPTGEALREHWLAKLPPGEAAILRRVIESFPRFVSREDLSDATGYLKSSRDAYIRRLKSRQLVAVSGEGVAASDHLFGEA